MSLDPLRAHYLKKSLISLQFRNELLQIHNVSSLALLGLPFRSQDHQPADLPFLSYILHHFVLSFPLMAAAPADFYPDKLQPFVDSLLARNLADLHEHHEPQHRAILSKLERSLAMFLSSSIKLKEPEDILRLSQADLDALKRAVDRRLAKRRPPFHVNIVSVRTVSNRGRVRSRVHEEFIIRTTLSHDRQVCVSRRYGDFRTLVDELRKAHPDSIVPSPPPKDRTAVHTPQPNGPHPTHRLSREKNRLTLRAYLHTLLATPPFASSPVLRSFLLSGPTRLSPQEQEDARRREEADRVREQGRKEFAREIGARVDHLRQAVRAVKGEIVGRDGLSRVFAVIKVTPNVGHLPDNYRAVLEWARISFASTIFQTFVASDNSSETFASLKHIHGLMPYFLLKGALKISNPVAMIRSVLDIFLAQPFGGRSLLQRIFSSSLAEEVKTLNVYIEHVSAKINSSVLCEKVRIFVYSSRETQETYRTRARVERTHLLRAILMGDEEPTLSSSLAVQVDNAWNKWAAWMTERQQEGRGMRNDSDSEDGPNDEDAWLFEDLRILTSLYSRLRDREQLIALIFEGVTAELLKDIITIFYTPLAQVYRAASISESLGDLQNFINDLIRTVERTEDLSQSDPSTIVQAFIDLVNRHEQSFYSFVHKVHSKGQGLFDSLMKWIERFLTAIREGIGASDEKDNKIVLDNVLPAGSEERAKIMEEVDRLVHWHYLNKIAREEKLRSRFRRAQEGAEKDADAEDEATREMIDDVAREFDFGDLVRADADELAEEESDEDEDSNEDEDSDEDEDEDGMSDEDTDEGGEEVDTETMPTREKHQVPSDRSLTMRPPPLKAETIQVMTRPVLLETSKLSRSQSSLPPQLVPPRKRTLSLRSIKSMKLLGKHHSKVAAPPVPPLPVHLTKPLPPDPPGPSFSKRRSTGHPNSGSKRESNGDPLPPSPSPHRPRKRMAATAEPPELKYIPTLLPIFVEMVRPVLLSQS